MALNRMYIRDTNAVIVCYDVTKNSLQDAQLWVDEIKEVAPTELVIALVGTKSDTAMS